jgi:hypothetical protein
MKHLKEMAMRLGVSVVATLHQPSHDAWALLDACSFLSKGRLVYFGNPGDMLLKFLAHTGNEVPQHANIPDFVLSIINSDFAAVGVKVADLDVLVEEFVTMREAEKQAGTWNKDRETRLLCMAEETGFCERFCDKADAGGLSRASFLTRFVVLAGRDVKELTRDPGVLGVRVFMYTFLSFIIGVMYLRLGNGYDDSSITGRIGILFYVAAFMVSSPHLRLWGRRRDTSFIACVHIQNIVFHQCDSC